MLDIALIRENPGIERENLARRKDSDKLALFDMLVAADTAWRAGKYVLQDLQKRRNDITREVGRLKKAGEDASAVLAEMKELPDKVKSGEEHVAHLKSELDRLLLRVPNLMHK